MITQDIAVTPRGRSLPASRRPAPRAVRQLRGQARALLAILVMLAFVVPIYLTVVNAFKTNPAITSSPGSLPFHPTAGNLSAALNQPGGVLQTGLRNSLIVVVSSVAILIPLSAAFSLVSSSLERDVFNTRGL